MPMTYGQLVQRLCEEVPSIGEKEARKRIARSVQSLNDRHEWPHRLTSYRFVTEELYKTGTLAIAAGGTAVTLTDGTWSTSWTTAPSTRTIVIQGRTEPYSITINTTTTGTLASAWLGDAVTEATYRMFREDYPAPSDCDWGDIVSIVDLVTGLELDYLGPRTFNMTRRVRGTTGIPSGFTVFGATSESPSRLRIYPEPTPSAERPYELWYYKKVPFPSSDAEYPLWPAKFENMIWIDAAIEHCSSLRSLHKALPLLRERFTHLWYEMKTTVEGSSAVRHHIRGQRLGKRNGGIIPTIGSY